MIETKHIIAELSVQEKICLYNALYEDLANKGIDGDTELAHVNKAEMDVLRAMGGSGTINPNTGLIQFGGGGSPPPPPPAASSVTQQTEFPTELKPYITDVLSKAQAIQEKRESEGYIPYEGPQVASFTPEQEQAFEGISGLVGQGEQYFDPATRLAASSAIAPRAGEVQQYMSPYMQNVVDIQQREAQRQADVAAQQLGTQAVGAGAYGGSRQAILEAEQQRNLQTQLGDIQARGLAAAYEDAQARMAAQRGRELAASSQFAQLGQIAPQQALKELTALEAVGAQQQAQSQRGLDIARSQFQAEQTFPEQTLQQYQSVIRGFPLAPSTYQTSQTTTPAPSYLQQAAGLGTTAIGLAGAFGGFKAKGGLVSRMSGGQIDQNSGLGSIVVKKQEGGGFVPPTRSRFTDPNYQNPIGKSIEELVDALGKGLIDPPTFEARIEQLKKEYNKAGMPLEQEPIPKELGRSPLSVSPAEARIAAQERKMGLSMVDQPVTPSLETEEEARRMLRQRQLGGTSTDLLNRAIIRQEAEAGSGASDVGMADPFPSDYKISSKETEAEARRMARERQLRSLLPTKKITETPASTEKSMVDPTSPMSILQDAMRNPKLANAPTTMGIPIEEMNKKDIDPISQQAMLREAMRNPKFALNEQIQAGMSGADQPTAVSAAAPTAVSAAAPQAGDEMPSNAEMAGMREGLKDFAPLTSDPETAKDFDKLETATAQKAPSIVNQDKGAGRETNRNQAAFNQQAERISEISPTKNSFINKFKDKYSEDLAKFDSILDERKGKKASAAERRKANLEKDKYLALAQVGLNILSQDGGQTFLQALGKGSKNVIPTLMKLNREELEIAENLDDLDFETAKEKLGFSKAQYDKYVKDRMLNFEERKVKADEAKVGATIGSGLTLGEVVSYVSAFTTLPEQAIERDKFIAFVDQQVRRDALIGLTPVQRADDSTVKESMRRLLNDAKYMGRISNNFTKQTGERVTQPMGGAPAGNVSKRPSATVTLTDVQERLGGSRSGTPVTR